MKQPVCAFVVRALVVLMLLSVAVTAAGCGSDDSGSRMDEAVAAMMKKIPRGTDAFGYFDVDALRSDNDLAAISDTLMGDWDAAFGALSMPVDDIDAVGFAGEETMVFAGSFDLDEIRDVLDDGGMDDDEYLDVEIWQQGDVGLALVSKDCIIFQLDGDIEDCVDAMKGKRPSVYDDEDVAGTVGRLPASLIVLYGAEGGGIFGDLGLDDLEATAVSMDKADADTLAMVLVFRFEDEDAADDAIEDIEDNMKEDPEGVDPDTVEIERDGRYVEVTAEAAIGTFAS